MAMYMLCWLGLGLGVVGFLLRIILAQPKWNYEIGCYLVGALVFGLMSAVSFNPVEALTRNDILLIVLLSYLGADLANRLMAPRPETS